MRRNKQANPIFLASIALMLLLVSPGAFAYLDPSTGSMVISAIVGIIASIALALKTYWYRIKAFFRRDGKKESSSQQPPE
jgi:O-antigen/teichoic acid export membrane protein